MNDLYIGLISGTSMDAIDAALVDCSATPKLKATHSVTLPDQLKQTLWQLITATTLNKKTLYDTDRQLGYLFAQATNELLKKTTFTAKDICAIGSHGQTIQHQPNADPAFTLQVGNADIIMRETGITTIANFRAADIAAGGQGAPLAPLFHHQFMHSTKINRAIVNIGGIANITLLPKDNTLISGFDTGPGNGLLDDWISHHQNKLFDDHGQWAATGKIEKSLLNNLLADPFFNQSPPKSTGKDYFNLQWLQPKLHNEKANDVQATLAALTAHSIIDVVKKQNWDTTEILICGGGVHNLDLLNRLQTLAGDANVISSMSIGFHPDWLEVMLFAWLAKLRLENQMLNTQPITGATHPILLGDLTAA